MNTNKTILLLLCCLILVLSGCTKKRSADLIQIRNYNSDVNVLFEKNSDKPFSGIIFGNYSDNTKSFILNVKDGKLHGKVESWFKNGQKQYELEYQDGLLNGDCQEWYENGSLRFKSLFIKNFPEGKFEMINDQGKSKFQVNYLGGKKNGQYLEWLPDGSKKVEGNFESDLRTGKWMFYDDKGSKKLEGEYTQNLRSGKWLIYGNLCDAPFEVNIVNGIPVFESWKIYESYIKYLTESAIECPVININEFSEGLSIIALNVVPALCTSWNGRLFISDEGKYKDVSLVGTIEDYEDSWWAANLSQSLLGTSSIKYTGCKINNQVIQSDSRFLFNIKTETQNNFLSDLECQKKVGGKESREYVYENTKSLFGTIKNIRTTENIYATIVLNNTKVLTNDITNFKSDNPDLGKFTSEKVDILNDLGIITSLIDSEITTKVQEYSKFPEGSSTQPIGGNCDEFLKGYEKTVSDYIDIMVQCKKDPTNSSLISELTKLHAEVTVWVAKVEACKSDPEFLRKFSEIQQRLAIASSKL